MGERSTCKRDMPGYALLARQPAAQAILRNLNCKPERAPGHVALVEEVLEVGGGHQISPV